MCTGSIGSVHSLLGRAPRCQARRLHLGLPDLTSGLVLGDLATSAVAQLMHVDDF